MLRRTVGMLGGIKRPVLMGKGYLRQDFYKGANYIEVDIDISSSFVARQIFSSIMGISTKCIVDEAFVLESTEQVELPERPLALQRIYHVDVKKVGIPLNDNEVHELQIPVVSHSSDSNEEDSQNMRRHTTRGTPARRSLSGSLRLTI
jgi:hypothetical protein